MFCKIYQTLNLKKHLLLSVIEMFCNFVWLIFILFSSLHVFLLSFMIGIDIDSLFLTLRIHLSSQFFSTLCYNLLIKVSRTLSSSLLYIKTHQQIRQHMTIKTIMMTKAINPISVITSRNQTISKT